MPKVDDAGTEPSIFDGLKRRTDSYDLVRFHEERRCSILGPAQSRISPSILYYTKIADSYEALLTVTHRY